MMKYEQNGVTVSAAAVVCATAAFIFLIYSGLDRRVPIAASQLRNISGSIP